MKCGTSALHYYLDLHPATSMSAPKELNFFLDELDQPAVGAPALRVPPLLRGNWSRGVDWYARQFAAEAPVRGESSPTYTAPWFPFVAERMASVVPSAKLVLMVRDPIERAVSHYMSERAVGRERRSVEDALPDPTSPYLTRSRYWLALEPFLRHYNLDDVLIIAQEDLRDKRREVMAAVYRFAGIDAFWSPKMERQRNVSKQAGSSSRWAKRLERTRAMGLAYKLPDNVKWAVERVVSRPAARPRIAPTLHRRLAAELRDDIDGLRDLTGRQFEAWSV